MQQNLIAAQFYSVPVYDHFFKFYIRVEPRVEHFQTNSEKKIRMKI